MGIVGEADLLPVGDFAEGLAAVIEGRALEIAEVADVVGWAVGALTGESGFAGLGQADAAGEDEVEDDGVAGVGFAPDAEVAIELIAEAIGLGGGADGEADGAGRTHVGGATDFAAEGFTEDAGHGWEFRAATGDVERVEVQAGMGSEQALDDFARGFDEGTAALVVGIDGNGNLGPAGTHALEIDGDFAGLRVERFFFLAALLAKTEPFGAGQVDVERGGFHGEIGEDLIEVVATEVRNAVGGVDGVLGFAEGDEGDVEGAAAHVVNEETGAGAAVAFGAVAVGELDGRGRGFVHEADDGEAGVLRCLFGEESLVAVGVGGDAEDDFEGLAGFCAEVGVIEELGTEGDHHLGEQEAERDEAAAGAELGVGAGIAEGALEGAENGPAVVAEDGNGLPAVEAGVTADRDDGRKPVAGLAVGGLEVDEGEVASVDRSNDDPCRSEVDADSHWVQFTTKLCGGMAWKTGARRERNQGGTVARGSVLREWS